MGRMNSIKNKLNRSKNKPNSLKKKKKKRLFKPMLNTTYVSYAFIVLFYFILLYDLVTYCILIIDIDILDHLRNQIIILLCN